MKRFANKFRVGIALFGVIIGLCIVLLLGSVSRAEVPTTVPALDNELKAANLCNTGINEALAGRFTEALGKLREAERLDPESKISARAMDLLLSYTVRRNAMRTEREKEYQYEVDRVRHAFLAQDYVETLKAEPYYKEFSTQIRQNLQKSYRAIGTARGFEESSPEDAAEMKRTSIEEIDKCVIALNAGVEFLKDNDSKFAEEFCRESNILRKFFKDYRNIWSKVNPKTQKKFIFILSLFCLLKYIANIGLILLLSEFSPGQDKSNGRFYLNIIR